jgi:mono/diheme cytochrome c family protein
MRLLGVVAVCAVAAAILPAPGVKAAELQYGRASIPPKLPDLGPAGNGRRLFVELNCTLCHGDRAAGQFGPNIQHAEKGDVTEAVKQGDPGAGMPSFGKYVTTTDLANITAYIAGIGTANEPMWFDWWVPYPKQ